MITRPLSRSARNSKHIINPIYSASFTIRSRSYLDYAATIVHSGNFHITALYEPPFFFILANPSKLATSNSSSAYTVRGGIDILSRQSFRGVIAISISSISSLGVILAANIPKICSSPFSHFFTSIFQLDSKASQRPNLPLSPRDCINHASVECRVNTVIFREACVV